MTIYSTKRALTRGIEKVEVRMGSAAVARNPSRLYPVDQARFESFTLGVDAFKRLCEAEKKAEEMRARKIESLCKQINKLKNMTFDA